MRPLLLLAAALAATAAEWSGLTPPTAPVAKADAVVTAADGTRLALVVRHPRKPSASCPVVVFSHGLGGSKDGYAWLGDDWAARGYVAIHLTHPGSDTSLITAGGGAAAIAGRLRAATRDPAIFLARPRQVGAVIDALADIERQVPALRGRLDAQRIAVAGHSYGAWTTLVAAGMALRTGATGVSLADPRPRAFIALSPPGPQDRTDARPVTRPVLVMTGSEDRQPAIVDDDPEHDGAWRARVFSELGAGDKWLVWIEGVTHSTFSGGAGARLMREAPAPDPRHLACIRASCAAFLDAHVRDDAAARAWLAEGPRALADGVRVERR